MVWINDQHFNEKSPSGVMGGSMCTCSKCENERNVKMKRMSITVTTRNDINYDANHLSIEKQIVDGKSYSQLSFLCSGIRTTLMAEAVKSITFSIDNATWCSECDGTLLNMV